MVFILWQLAHLITHFSLQLIYFESVPSTGLAPAGLSFRVTVFETADYSIRPRGHIYNYFLLDFQLHLFPANIVAFANNLVSKAY